MKRSLAIISISILLVWLILKLTATHGVAIDATHPEFPTGITVEKGKFHVVFQGGWNLDRHNPRPADTRNTWIGPEGIPEWPESEKRPWAFPELPKMGTGLQIGSKVIAAQRDFVLDVEPEWLKGQQNAEIIVLINDIAGTHYDNGPGIWFTRYLPVWKRFPYSISVKKIGK
jgi:hypothetical protein